MQDFENTASPSEPQRLADSTFSAHSAAREPSTQQIASDAHLPFKSHQTALSSGSATTAGTQEGSRLNPSHAEALQSRRKLSPRLCEQHGVWSLDSQTIAFDYRVNGQVHNTKLRRGKGNMPWQEGGKDLVLWNIDCLKEGVHDDEFVVLTEGEFDALAALEAGLTRVVSVPNGAQSNEGGFSYLFRGGDLIPELDKFKTIVLAMDNDPKGIAARDAMAVRIGDERCKHVVYPDDCKDLNDVLLQHGKNTLWEICQNARPMWTDEVCRFDDIPQPEKEQRYRTGIFELDHHGLRITLPCFMPVVGPYASGKSVLVRQLITSLWQLHDWPFLVTAFEERPKPRFQRDFRRHLISKPEVQWTQEDIEAADQELDRAAVILRKKPRVSMNMERLLDRIEYAVKVYGVKVVVIDPINSMSHEVPPGMSMTVYMGRFMENLKELASDYKLLVIPVVHPPKDSVEKRLSQNKVLTLNDGEGTNNWGNKADIGLVVWRNIDGPTYLNIDKVKDHETMGKPTMAELKLDPAMNSFSVVKMGRDVVPGGA